MQGRICAAGVVMALALVGAAGPARAELVTKADPEGVADVPNVKRITLDNRQKAAVIRMRYDELSDMDEETFFIDWGGENHYQVTEEEGEDGYGYTYEYYALYLHKGEESTRKSCYIRWSGDTDQEASGVRVPRSCLKKAPDKIRARGIAYANGTTTTSDETPYTPYAERG